VFAEGHALVIGVDAYAHAPELNIPKNGDDARTLAETLQNPDFCHYDSAKVKLLTGTEAKRQAVKQALTDFAALDEHQTVFLFYSGHGLYDEDGHYYLTMHDTELRQKTAQQPEDIVKPGSGISEFELIELLQAIKARRVIAFFNACYAGSLSPTLGQAAGASKSGHNLRENTRIALLGTGEGRIIITACRDDQVSYVGGNRLTLFSQALVEGLQGEGTDIVDRGGYISAFDLYDHIYSMLQEWVRMQITQELRTKYGELQQPEMSVIKAVGPFSVAYFRGAQTLGGFDAPVRPKQQSGLHEIDKKDAISVMERILQIGDIVHGDKVGGDKITVGDIGDGAAVAIGRGAQATVNAGGQAARISLDALFVPLEARITISGKAAPIVDALHLQLDTIKRESSRGLEASSATISNALQTIRALAPEIYVETKQLLISPAFLFAPDITAAIQALPG
jgi:uncharacterized caspase-like protein